MSEKSDKVGISGQEAGRLRDIAGLTWTHRFGWLRPQELGMLLWPRNSASRKYGEALVRKWQRHNLVITRSLPRHAGSGIVLSQRGADFLKQNGVPGKSGKDWGETHHGVWVAPRWWRHDLLAMGVLAIMHSDGYQIIPERQLRRECECVKFPDGLILSPDGKTTWWVEVESARKSGKAMTEMVEMLVKVAQGSAPKLAGRKATNSLLCFVEGETDERGLSLNHGIRVMNAIERTANADTRLEICKLELSGQGVSALWREVVTVESDSIAKWIQRMENIGWHKNAAGQQTCFMSGNEFVYWRSADGWAWQVRQHKNFQDLGNKPGDDEPRVSLQGTSGSATKAKRALAEIFSDHETVFSTFERGQAHG